MSLIIKHIQDQISKNRNFVGLVVGRVGTGKSYTSMRLAETLDSKFNVDKVVFKIEDLLEMVHNNTLEKGEVILFDEGGIAISNRQHYMNKFNKAMAFLLQTWRHRNIIMFITVPDISFVDAGIRKLFDAIIECQEVVKSRRVVRVKWKWIQVNTQSGKAYFHNPKARNRLKRLEIGKPSVKLINRYEKKKTAFTTELYKKIQEELKPEEENKIDVRTCAECGSKGVFMAATNTIRCRGCGYQWDVPPKGDTTPIKLTNV